ncbi:Citrate lyase acyl carrier protein [Austwickia sp. TVS 96-490-7B]|uniref:citrate lyase acyl carrier protein n=1 Tax=Austwickia sp. TVS 96-490-7B TaxID=2830843 RepID=UPI001C599521|nr:citrate lyase acyl carrier protein [Austwickia sp. TVS 96-490-7B]MBW3085014.1 Citrate lyase acyl carrier protein [Austwickia sp. TVS 96-490-7B]
MQIIQPAVAGTLESSDLMVRITPPDRPDGAMEVVVTSTVMAQFGDAIREVVSSTLQDLGVHAGHVLVEDKGALDFTIRARVQAACLRGSGAPDAIDWARL